MDLNIGIAFWLAAGGDGWVYEENSKYNDENCQGVRYKSKARIVLVGSGADEQCAGYGRHRTKYRSGSWLRLHEEMKLDMQRIWKRNLGRDDRCIADTGKEARFPFLDEDVIRTLLGIPLWEVTNLDQPSGIGDKKILREVAELLGLHEAATLPKRAIQFGTRIARESNRKNFGSNRAANQASAGSAVIHKQRRPSHGNPQLLHQHRHQTESREIYRRQRGSSPSSQRTHRLPSPLFSPSQKAGSQNADKDADLLSLAKQDWENAKSVVNASITRGVTVEVPKVTWDDTGGLKDLKIKLQQAVEWPIKYSAEFSRLGISPIRGILLYGPPGCSKTTLAKAAANAAQASFFFFEV
ncbi:hypothetical protein ACLB2K_042866 [Fragaria x ananassa]